ncbi:hypothetical protein FQR65_LT05033 [Abscondita terminalis]|nr:hypothetical protein FQR65_LT05033 [Abscondita terminalis]
MCFLWKHLPAIQSDIELLKRSLNQSLRLFVLTGAVISTKLGIPDYHSQEVSLCARTDHRPVLHSECLNSETVHLRLNDVGWEVVELRGSGDNVSSLNYSIRYDVQDFIKELNRIMTETTKTIRPDRDIEISEV